MEKIEIIINNRNIKLYGSKATIEKEKQIIENLELVGIEDKDRLIIQKCIDENKLKSDILYEGNSVYSFEKTIKEYRKLQKDNSLGNLTNYMYDFFMNACGDIAHYDKVGYRYYYNDSIVELENRFLKDSYISTRFSDVNKIFKELKIGSYFKERNLINIDNVSIKKLESIIKESNWNITKNNEKWKLDKNTIYGNNFSFEVDISDNKISNIVQQIQDKCQTFNKDEYVENMVATREKLGLTISEIVGAAGNIQRMLSNLSFNTLYKTRLIAEEKDFNERKLAEKSNEITKNNLEKDDNFDYEYT